MLVITLAVLLAAGAVQESHPAPASPPAGVGLVIHEADTMVRQPPPHNGRGMSTAYRISGVAPNRSMEFRKRVMHPGSSIGLHVIAHDEVYHVVSGEGDVTTDGVTTRMKAGDTAYLYDGGNVGIQQVGADDLVLIIAYPLARRTD